MNVIFAAFSTEVMSSRYDITISLQDLEASHTYYGILYSLVCHLVLYFQLSVRYST